MASTKLNEMTVAQARNMERLQSDLRIKEEQEIAKYKHDLNEGDNARNIARSILSDMNGRYGVQHGNANNGNIGWFGNLTPYMTINVPQSAMPSNFNQYKGYACNKILALNSLSGYTEVDEIHLDGLGATTEELDELEAILKSGFVIN